MNAETKRTKFGEKNGERNENVSFGIPFVGWIEMSVLSLCSTRSRKAKVTIRGTCSGDLADGFSCLKSIMDYFDSFLCDLDSSFCLFRILLCCQTLETEERKSKIENHLNHHRAQWTVWIVCQHFVLSFFSSESSQKKEKEKKFFDSRNFVVTSSPLCQRCQLFYAHCEDEIDEKAEQIRLNDIAIANVR